MHSHSQLYAEIGFQAGRSEVDWYLIENEEMYYVLNCSALVSAALPISSGIDTFHVLVSPASLWVVGSFGNLFCSLDDNW